MTSLRGRTAGTDTYSGPFQASATSWRMNDIPMAVINGASRGAPRNGRYAMYSIVAFSTPQMTIAATSVMMIAGISELADALVWRSKAERMKLAEIIPP